MSIILVTGAAGLIGSESVRFFADRGFTVVGIDNNMRQVFFGEDASTEWNRDRLLQDYSDKYIHHNVDIRDHEGISQIFQTYSQDISLILLEQQHLIGASNHGISEEFPLDKARSLYGSTKLASELLITEYADAYGIRTLINRCGVLTGPWQMGKVDQGVFALWMAFHYFQKPLKYIGYGGTGKQVRDFLHIADLLDLIDIQICSLEDLKGQTFNVGGGVNNTLSLSETTQLCEEITGNQIPITPIPENRIGDVPIFITDSRKVMNATGWQPQRDAKTTLTEIYEWICQFESQVSDIFN
ncbi:MAG: NAD-dependent epimerase/dehydratase family protein [Dolichospermum sp.]